MATQTQIQNEALVQTLLNVQQDAMQAYKKLLSVYEQQINNLQAGVARLQETAQQSNARVDALENELKNFRDLRAKCPHLNPSLVEEQATQCEQSEQSEQVEQEDNIVEEQSG